MINIKLLIEDKWYPCESKGEFIYKDIKVTFNDGKLCITGDKTPVMQICAEMDNIFFNDALILGDAWERGYSDLEWKKPDFSRKLPWYFFAYEDKKTYGFGVKTLPNSICYWNCDGDKITLTADIKNGNKGLVLDGKTLDVCQVITGEYEGDAFDSARDFCSKLCDTPRNCGPIFGGNDWYCNYGNNSFEKILTHARRVAECSRNCENKPYMVIDDGWQICHNGGEGDAYFNGGPWSYCNMNFGDMKAMADAIADVGVIPGIWMRPLWTAEKLPEEWVLKNNGIKVTLDPSVPDVLEQVKSDIRTICNWGYKLIKHDFSTFDYFGRWGWQIDDAFCVTEGEPFDKTLTNAQIIKIFYYAIREAAGEDVLIMGCNTIAHLSAGIFDIQRTGDDTSGYEWERTKKYGTNTLAFRMLHHNTFGCVDADCVGITRAIPWEKNKLWLDVVSKSGTALFVSIADDAYTDEVQKDITSAFEKIDKNTKPSKPLDWMETLMPTKWQSVYGIDEYNW
ncbi:MAG: alpha-galactosidase [Eubacteriales bacterium]|nr:alpha-galactosidase [Eubacteriales bacterium]